jgi:hypothetical protein
VAQVFQNNIWHGHAQGCGKILLRHGLLFHSVGEEAYQTSREILGVTRFVKLKRHAFAIRHLTEIFQIRAHDRDSIGAGQVRYSAAAG